MNDIIVRYVDLPPSVNGFIMEDPAGDGNIYLNKNKPERVQRETLDHEIAHFVCGHLKDPRPVAECESEAEKKDPSAGTDESKGFDDMPGTTCTQYYITADFSLQEVKYA